MQDEKEFYEYIKVSIHIALLGIPQQLKEENGGFSYSIEDMKNLM